jgi:hypothetical protein
MQIPTPKNAAEFAALERSVTALCDATDRITGTPRKMFNPTNTATTAPPNAVEKRQTEELFEYVSAYALSTDDEIRAGMSKPHPLNVAAEHALGLRKAYRDFRTDSLQGFLNDAEPWSRNTAAYVLSERGRSITPATSATVVSPGISVDAFVSRCQSECGLSGHGLQTYVNGQAPIQAEREWNEQPDVRKGFSCKENYLAFRKAELTGHYTGHRPTSVTLTGAISPEDFQEQCKRTYRNDIGLHNHTMNEARAQAAREWNVFKGGNKELWCEGRAAELSGLAKVYKSNAQENQCQNY